MRSRERSSFLGQAGTNKVEYDLTSYDANETVSGGNTFSRAKFTKRICVKKPPFVLPPCHFELRKLLIQEYKFLTLETTSPFTFEAFLSLVT